MKKEFNKNSPQAKTTTYVVFLSSGTLFSAGKSREVESRDPKKLKVPDNAHGFYFFDQTSIVINGETLTGKVKNEGKLHLVGDNLMTLADLKAKHPQGGSVLDQMERKHIRYVVRNNGDDADYQSVKHDSIVVNNKGEVVFPTPAHQAAQARLDTLLEALPEAEKAGLPQTVSWVGKYLAAAKDAADLRTDDVNLALFFSDGAKGWRNPVKPADGAGSEAKGKYIVSSLVAALASSDGKDSKDYLLKKLSAEYLAMFPAAAKKPAAPQPGRA